MKRFRYCGWRRYCAACNSHVRYFRGAGVIRRPNVICPVCESAERHRLAWFFLSQHTNLADGNHKRILHVAPESSIRHNIENLTGVDYFSASHDGLHTRVKMDVAAIPFAGDYFDGIYCSHVLEHVADDRDAMNEFYRVLKPGGWALLQVPVSPGLPRTYEDPSVTDAREREQLFGQEDHVRLYGADYPDRLKESGFAVTVLHASEVVGEARIERWGIDPQEDIFYCRKGVSGAGISTAPKKGPA